MIQAFIGVIGSGKDYRAKELVRKGFVQVDFKAALLKMTEDLVGFPIKDYDLFKSALVGLTATGQDGNAERVSCTRMTEEVLRRFPQAMTGRVLLQRLGTDVMRKRDDAYWAREWSAAARYWCVHERDVVVADCRFRNEVEAIKDTGRICRVPVMFTFCDYRSPRYNAAMTHESERMAQELLAQGYQDGQQLDL